MFKYAWTHRQGLGFIAVAVAAALAAMAYALGVDEGRKQHIIKQLSEAAAMPGRLLT